MRTSPRRVGLLRPGNHRPGTTLVLVAFLMVALLGFAAFAVDLSQMLAVRSQMEVAADAAALSATTQLARPRDDSASLRAAQFATLNPVRGQSTFNTVDYGTWNTFTRTFSPYGCNPGCDTSFTHRATAIRVAVRASGAPIFAGFLDSFGFAMSDTSVGYLTPHVGTTTCLHPWAIPYTALTAVLGGGSPTRNLTNNDLRQLQARSVQLRTVSLVPKYTPATPGSFVPIAYPTGSDVPAYQDNVSETCPASSYIGQDSNVTSLDPSIPLANIQTATTTGADLLCTPRDADGACRNSLGNVGVPVKVVLWDNAFPGGCGTPGNPCTFNTRIVGGFSLDTVLPTRIVGHFLKLVDPGTLDLGQRGMLARPVLVR